MSVYHHTSGKVNPITHGEFTDYVVFYSRRHPYQELYKYPKMALIQSKSDFLLYYLALEDQSLCGTTFFTPFKTDVTEQSCPFMVICHHK